MKILFWLILLLLLIWLAPIAEPAEDVVITWGYDAQEEGAVGFEIDLRAWRGAWFSQGVLFDITATRYTFAMVSDGVYQSRVRAFAVDGRRSLNSNICTFRVPYVPPHPPPTHVRLTVTGGPSDIVLLDPIGRSAFYKLMDDGTPQVWKSADQLNWSPLGSSGSSGNYCLKSTLITITP